jgi:lysophospholipase L1-like esterase
MIVSAVASLAAAGCTTSAGIQPFVVHEVLTAVGASDAVGVGSSIPCATAGSPAIVTPPSCGGGNAYPPKIVTLLDSSSLQVGLNDLGISGAVIGPDIKATVNDCGQGAPGDFITNEEAFVAPNSAVVTIFAGGNDTDGIVRCAVGIVLGSGDPSAFIAAQITNFANDYASLIASIHTTAPSAKIYLANLPNFKFIPEGQSQPPGVQSLLDTVSLTIDLEVIDPLAASPQVSGVVDLLCDPRSYQPAYFSADGFHPNDAGYSIFTHAFVNVITSPSPPAPSSSCSPFTTAEVRRPLTAADVAGAHLPKF